MSRWKNSLLLVGAAVVVTALLLILYAPRQEEPIERQPLALMTSLPIYWSEGGDIASFASGNAPVPWVREVIERRYEITPLDSFSAEGGVDPLAGFDRLLIVQPRGLSPEDNVVLDEWVRGGGQLIYALDPMLTGHYGVPFSDPTHPTAVGLIPPVLLRWGLTLRFDDFQPLDLRQASYGEAVIPVQMAGEVVLLEDDRDITEEERDARGDCTILGDAIAATCRVGDGHVFLVADAALFEVPEADGTVETQLMMLLETALERTN